MPTEAELEELITKQLDKEGEKDEDIPRLCERKE